MSKARHRRRPKRLHASKDAPLVVPATAVAPAPTPPPAPGKGRWILRVLALVPTHDDTPEGRQGARFVKLGIGVLAALAMSQGREHWAWGALAIGLALTTLAVPTSRVRIARHQRRAKALMEPGQAPQDVPAEWEFDDRKLSLRVGGRVRASLRPQSPPADLVLRSSAPDGPYPGALVFGLRPSKGKDAAKRVGLWIVGPSDALTEPTSGDEDAYSHNAAPIGGSVPIGSGDVLATPLPDPMDGPVARVDREGFRALVAHLMDPRHQATTWHHSAAQQRASDAGKATVRAKTKGPAKTPKQAPPPAPKPPRKKNRNKGR